MRQETAFLADSLPRPWTPPAGFGWDQGALHVGHGDHAIEVVAARSASVPTAGSLLRGWKTRTCGPGGAGAGCRAPSRRGSLVRSGRHGTAGLPGS